MTGRERMKNAMHFRPVDKAPLQYSFSRVGFYEHGEKLNDLYASVPGDFDPFVRQPIPVPPASDFDANGNYLAYKTDEWGVVWQYRIYGIAGIVSKNPIQSEDDIDSYCVPPAPACQGAEFEEYAAAVKAKKEAGFYARGDAGSLFEQMQHLYGEVNVMCDIAMDTPQIHTLADKICQRLATRIERCIKAGTDCVVFGDDFGTERAMLIGPEMWRNFFKPRYQELMKPIVAAGMDIHFHSCGYVKPILEDLKEIGVTSIWPQLPLYNMEEFAQYCREIGLAVAIHTDRANTMTYGTPQQVRDLLHKEFEIFRMMDGGSWFYVEADNGFPYENLEAMIQTIAQWR